MTESLLTQYARQFIRQMPMAVILFDPDQRILDRNPAARELLPAGDILPQILVDLEPPEKCSWSELFSDFLLKGQTRSCDQVVFHQDRRDRFLKLTAMPLTAPDSSTLVGGCLLIEDVTRQTLMTRDLATAERMAALGKLSSKVAHELNNPLDGIIRYLSLAVRLTEQQGNLTILKYLKEAHRGMLRMVHILSDMLDFSRQARSSSEYADVNKLIEDAVRTMELKADEFEIDIVRDLQDPMPNIRSGNLYQVFCNLIKNAIDAMPDGGTITIASETDSETMTISCRDQGTGINPDDLDMIFEPFFTTKDAGKGTGLGLPICRDIIERGGGRLTVTNNPDRGCTFKVTIPLDQTSWADGRPDSNP